MTNFPRMWIIRPKGSPLLALLLILVSGGARLMAQPRTRVDVSRLGPQVGQRVPEFELRDQLGHPQTLRSIMGPKGAMLVFIRSADW